MGDAQNLFHTRGAFGYTDPSHDVSALTGLIGERQPWKLAQARFATLIPDLYGYPKWHCL